LKGIQSKMGKEKLVHTIKKILETDLDLDFLSNLDRGEIEILLVAIRYRLERENQQSV